MSDNSYNRRPVLHTIPEGPVVRAEFGEDTGRGSELDVALQEAGAIFPTTLNMPWEKVVLHREHYLEKLPGGVLSSW